MILKSLAITVKEFGPLEAEDGEVTVAVNVDVPPDAMVMVEGVTLELKPVGALTERLKTDEAQLLLSLFTIVPV